MLRGEIRSRNRFKFQHPGDHSHGLQGDKACQISSADLTKIADLVFEGVYQENLDVGAVNTRCTNLAFS